jgi:hypothetical protein
MEKNQNVNRLLELGLISEECQVFVDPSYDYAIVGASQDGRVIYDYNLMVMCLMNDDHMSEEDAMEFIDYNTIRTIPYMSTPPVILYPLDRYE